MERLVARPRRSVTPHCFGWSRPGGRLYDDFGVVGTFGSRPQPEHGGRQGPKRGRRDNAAPAEPGTTLGIVRTHLDRSGSIGWYFFQQEESRRKRRLFPVHSLGRVQARPFLVIQPTRLGRVSAGSFRSFQRSPIVTTCCIRSSSIPTTFCPIGNRYRFRLVALSLAVEGVQVMDIVTDQDLADRCSALTA